MKKLCLSLLSLLFVLGVSGCQEPTYTSSDDTQEESKENNENNNNQTPITMFQTEIEPDYEVTMEIKDYGTIVMELDEDKAPETVENFVELVEEDFYDGLTFHRIIEGFMMQGGDPTGTGYHGSDEEIIGEFMANGCTTNDLSHVRGAVSMARSSALDSASSQFFIVHQNSEFLDGQYAAFGYVKEGMEVVDAICSDAQPIDGNGGIAAEDQPTIIKMEVKELD